MGIFSRPENRDNVVPIRGTGAVTALPYSTTRSLTAAARSIKVDSRAEVDRMNRRRNSTEGSWQTEAWEYYDAIGEVKYAFTLVSNIMSRVRLYSAKVVDPGAPPQQVYAATDANDEIAVNALLRLDSAYGGQAGLLRSAALNLSVAGECYLVQQPGIPALGIPESWDIRSVDEVVAKDGRVSIRGDRNQNNSNELHPLPIQAFCARVWRPHPRFSEESDSSMRALLDNCAELLLLNRTFRATARSRLNAGAMFLPDSLSNAGSSEPAEPTLEGEDDVDPVLMAPPRASASDDVDEFEEALMEAMTTPIMDEESAAAVVPLIIRGPGDDGAKIKLFKFERSFDPALASRADRVLDRIMQGIDVPKDVVSGMSNVKYSNAVLIEESLYKAHIQPLVLLICDALSIIFLRPVMRAMGVPEAELAQYVIWFDPSEIVTRPNKSEDAGTGYDKHLLSGAAWRRVHGFTDDDAPTPTELVVRMLTDKGPITPELSEALLTVIAPEVMGKVREATLANSPAPLPDEVQQALAPPTDAPQPPPADGTAPAPAPAASPDGLPPADQQPETIDPGTLV